MKTYSPPDAIARYQPRSQGGGRDVGARRDVSQPIDTVQGDVKCLGGYERYSAIGLQGGFNAS